MAYRVVLAASALDDLKAIFLHVAEAADVDVATRYHGRIREACLRLTAFPNRGTPHDELERGLRSVPFERQATIYYRVEADTVMIVSVLHAGRDADRAFAGD